MFDPVRLVQRLSCPLPLYVAFGIRKSRPQRKPKLIDSSLLSVNQLGLVGHFSVIVFKLMRSSNAVDNC